MVLDVVSLLDPAAGLVAGSDVMAPSGDDSPLWRATASLACGHVNGPAAGSTQLVQCTAGACSTTRAGAMVRTAGEAVERMALHGPPPLVATAAELGDKALRFWGEHAGLAADPGERELRWYPATRLIDDQEYFVPAGLVDFPADPEDRPGFDPGPSGAAAGVGYDDALRSALLETVERDAVIVSWARQQRLLGIDLEAALANASRDREWENLSRAVTLARNAGMEPVFARIPLALDGLVCVVGGVRAPGAHHGLVSLGAKVSNHPGTALSAALQESFQLITALRLFESAEPADPLVSGESERIRFLASPAGVRALEDWLADPVASSPPATASGQVGATRDLVKQVVSDGLDPYVVDLTGQLPERARRLGWSVVKVVPVGYQPLRIDERCGFGWNRNRLHSLEQRTRVDARRASDEPSDLPHPLP